LTFSSLPLTLPWRSLLYLHFLGPIVPSSSFPSTTLTYYP
jgi:hypothetical protein